jgi:hypothetical protein
MKIRLLAALSLAAVVACSGLSTNFDYDTSYAFTKLSTYDWAGKEDSSLEGRRVRAAVDAALAARGIRRDSNNPDFQVAAHVSSRERTEVRDWGYTYRAHGGWYGSPNFDVYQYDEGTLVIDVIDPARHELVWRGTASKIIDEDWTPAEREQEIQAAVEALLKGFPPEK